MKKLLLLLFTFSLLTGCVQPGMTCEICADLTGGYNGE